MKNILPIVMYASVLCTTALNAFISSTSNLPKVFQESIPIELKGNLRLIEVKNRCNGCEPWRYIDFYSNGSKKPIKRVKVSVKSGYRAMYAYPDTDYFSNTKIEQSISGEYQHDIQKVIAAIKHEFKRKQKHVYTYLNSKCTS